jgi:hypothetical protein
MRRPDTRRGPGDEALLLQRLSPEGVSAQIFREGGMRRCAHCRREFRPKRSDAIYCQPLCKQAAHHGRKKANEAASAAALRIETKAEALRVIDQLTAHDSIATMLNALAKSDGLDLKFIPSLRGVIAAEEQPGAFDQAQAVLASFPYLEGKVVNPNWREDRQVAAAKKEEAYTTAAEDNPGTSFVAKEAQKQFEEVVSRGANVYELRTNPDYIDRRNRVLSARNSDEIFNGGLRCPSCMRSLRQEDGRWWCCDLPLEDTYTPKAPRGVPVSQKQFRFPGAF